MLEMENTNPPWLKQLLKANFYAVYQAHEDYRCNKCNRYCIECTGNPFYEYCLDDHENHQIIQISMVHFLQLESFVVYQVRMLFLTSIIVNWKGANILTLIFTYTHREAISRGSPKQTFAVETELSTGEIDDSFQIDQSSTPNRKLKEKERHSSTSSSNLICPVAQQLFSNQ
ncbi:uncharacterized protein LOC131323864 [Rhododendron vialii]|uniref:uncharacterized protein LOC131323864 n=1 Tax=Rhododendron vialii TaxID=182163 RepID=UPI00266043A8|nr:uncharacterized protein LOC131323864 [Rhododendron vialii]